MDSEPSRFAQLLYGLLPVVITVAVILVLVVIGGKAVQGYEMRQEARVVEQRIEQLRKQNRQLVNELDYYRSDEYIEKVAREELGLIREGEVAVAMLLPEKQRASSLQPTPTPTPIATPSAGPIPNWQKWLSVFVDQE
ncbi:MAG: FtsB family cell division protein [Chloroflexota bacterium]|jgi:cell division protein FtsL